MPNFPAIMGDVLPPKKQIVVERLKRRFELYRRHQDVCLPRYEQAVNGLYEAQRQETALLNQRHLELKAKKAKNNKSDHHRAYKDPGEGPKLQLHAKPIKRPVEETNASTDATNIEDSEKPSKIPRTETVQEASSTQELKQAQPLPSFSVQIVQQFSQAPHSQHSQTIQTNVTVQALSKPSNSPVPQTPTVTVSQSMQQIQESAVNQTDKNSVGQSVGNVTSTRSNVECKQEKDCGQTDLCQFQSNQECGQQNLCDFKTNQASNGSGDRLSDTFPSLAFTDESGDDVIHPDLLKDLIDDVFTNSADIMKDFNFDDSVGSMKDSEETAKDIIDLMKSTPSQLKPFQTDNMSFSGTSNQNQSNGGLRNIPSNNEVSMVLSSTTASTPTTTASSFFSVSSQRIPSYNNSGLCVPSGLGLDFKLTEPSPAALTLKQMAEQHQNMQQKQQHQQQLVNSSLTNRPSPFNQDSYSNHVNTLRSVNYINSSNNPVTNNSPKTTSTNTNIFNAFDRQINNFAATDPLNNYPGTEPNFPGTEPLNNFPGTEPISNFPGTEPLSSFSGNTEPVNAFHNSISPNIFEQEIRSRNSVVIADADRAKQQRLQMEASTHQIEQAKPPAYGITRPLTHYSDNIPARHPAPTNQQRIIGRQFYNNVDIRMQMQHPQSMHSAPAQQHTAQQIQQSSNELKHHNIMSPHSNMYGNYNSQQQMNPSFHVSVSQSMSYSTQFTPNQAVSRPPPEYKSHHSNVPADNLHLVEQLNNSSPMMYNNPTKSKYAKVQRAPNVTITSDGSAISASGNWRSTLVNPQHHSQYRMRTIPQQESFNVMRNDQLGTVPQPSIYNQYRMPNNHQPAPNRLVRPNMMPANHMLMVQRPRLPTSQRLRNPPVNEMSQHPIAINNPPLSQAPVMGSMYSNSQDMNRQDGSQINLDFLDNIESSASDLLNFDQVMQGGGPPFLLLDDMEMLDK